MNLAELAAVVKDKTNLPDLIGRSVKLIRKGRRMVGLCPFHSESTGSFTVFPENSPASFHCFGCGAHGTAIDWVMLTESAELKAAVEALAAPLGLSRETQESAAERRERQAVFARQKAERDAKLAAEEARRGAWRRANAGEIWQRAAHDTVLRHYFRTRGIDTALIAAGWGESAPEGVPLSLRFLMDCPDYDNDREDPAMVAPMVDHERRFRGVHRTYLNKALNDNRGFDKRKMLGAAGGAVVRLTAFAPRLHVCEGIETGLSVMAALALAGRSAGAAVFAALSMDNICGEGWGPLPNMRAPGIILPPGVTELIICEDADNKDPRMADDRYARAAARFGRKGQRLVRRARPEPGMDFNDVLRRAA
ncbi:DNA primase [Alphaproteobacteria bacterium SO-S41]|nr:DNA primase [Alphaproteobacteria bacterium SO-S41]